MVPEGPTNVVVLDMEYGALEELKEVCPPLASEVGIDVPVGSTKVVVFER